jgi:hypothetical protein
MLPVEITKASPPPKPEEETNQKPLSGRAKAWAERPATVEKHYPIYRIKL